MDEEQDARLEDDVVREEEYGEIRVEEEMIGGGVISIIDLNNDYYLVAFSHEDDKKATMTNGPWFIYDHYLTVQEWRPNFQPESDTIEEVVV
ncbi:unnamed protein product [Vicia faba]|uniref:DUF4283 domain-containing protein n=1 Tax=Vicia faba TaxID=3906 RepID=A0AAV0ZSG5_VICFA|nr:unnamed protein product [Vicia faba]